MRMRLLRMMLLAGACFATAACGSDDGNRPSGPITFVPVSYIIGEDTVRGRLTVDGTEVLEIARDSMEGFARGEHDFSSQLDIEYLERTERLNIDPPGDRLDFLVPYARSCRSPGILGNDCTGHNVVTWSGSRRIYCHVNDFGDFCTYFTDPTQRGLRWPAEGATLNDSYVVQAKLLIAAKAAPELGPAAGNLMAMGLHLPGDYGPRQRLTVAPGDSSRWTLRAWTDLRHAAFEAVPAPFLDEDDRPNDRFGLEVKTTYHLPTNQRDALFVRFDVKNISNEPAYRLVHPTSPAGGFTTQNIYLAPTVDVLVGPPTIEESENDNATVFAVDSLVVGYQQDFKVDQGFAATTANRPGLVGLRLLQAPAGVESRPFIVEVSDSLAYYTNAHEDQAYRMLAAGREGAPVAAKGCLADMSVALICVPETPNDPAIGWSVGPIASLAPGESRSVTVAIILAYPADGTFTAGTSVPPRNFELGSETRAIADIAEPLRALARAIAGRTVTPVP